MQKQTQNLIVVATTFVTSSLGLVNPTQAQSVQFECAVDSQGTPVTYAQAKGKTVQIFRWTSKYFEPPYTPVQRCQEVAKRLNQFQPQVLVAGRVRNYNVICAGESCDSSGSNILLTLKPNQNPAQTLAEIDNTRDGAGGPSYQLGGGNGQKIKRSNLVTTSNGSVALNLTGHIQSAPGVPLRLGNSSQNNSNNNSSTEQLTIPPSTTSPPKPPTSDSGTVW